MNKRSTIAFLGLVIVTSVSSSAMADNRVPWQSKIHGSPEPPAPYRIQPAFPNIAFDLPTSIEVLPQTNRLLVTEIRGKVFSFVKQPNAESADLVIDLAQHLPDGLAGQEVSLFDAEIHPNFAKNGHLFLCYVHPGDGGHTRVSQFTVSGSPPRAEAGSEQVIIRWPSGGHNAGCIEFGRDGYLYIATGDGSGPNPPDGLTTGQDVSDLLGAILRIDVSTRSGQERYTIPDDNPFATTANARGEIWAYGLRNPWKFAADPSSDRMYAADNGWETWEMVHRIERGGNCGWPIREGRAALRTDVEPGPTPIQPPVKDHHHSEANSVIGGVVYRGTKLPDLDGAFVYGGYITGTIWSIKPTVSGGYANDTLVDTDQRIIAFTQTSAGELLVLDYDFTGQIYELLPNNVPDTSATFPRQLSATGLFTSTETLTPAPGVVPYDVVAPRWVDGAVSRRWVAIPSTDPIKLASTVSNYPDGTVLVKHLDLPRTEKGAPRRLETQILHYENSTWRPYTYLWDDHGQDAVLVDSIGANLPLMLPAEDGGTTERTWHASAANECRLCHNAGSRFVLGFTLHQLNREADEGDSNQLSALKESGVLSDVPVVSKAAPGRLVNPHDLTQTIDDRARSYLHANCAMCHHPQGNAIVSFYLRRDMPFNTLNTNKGTGIGTFGMHDPQIITPGDPYRSILFYRMSKLGYARMPYIGSQVVDSSGIALVEEWIRSLPPDQRPLSSPATAGSQASRQLADLAANEPEDSKRARPAIERLSQSTEGALALSSLMHRGKLTATEHRTAIEVGRAAEGSDIRGLFETFVPESERRPVLGGNIAPDAILKLAGDPSRGRLIYFSDSARCRLCHEFNDRSQSVGPTLAEINKKYPNREEFLKQVLQPSLKVDDPFAAYTVSSTDGRVLTGLIIERNNEQLTLKTSEKKIERIKSGEVDEVRRSPVSLMPERLLSDLTAQEAADLISFLRSVPGE